MCDVISRVKVKYGWLLHTHKYGKPSNNKKAKVCRAGFHKKATKQDGTHMTIRSQITIPTNWNGRENPNAYGTSVDVRIIIYTKMAWNGKRQLQSASESLLRKSKCVWNFR